MGYEEKLIERIGCMLTGVTLSKKNAELLRAIVLPVIICSGVNLKEQKQEK